MINNLALWKKCISEAKWLLLACLVYVFGFSVLRIYVVSEFDTTTFQMLLKLLPDRFKSFTPVDADWLISYSGRIALGLDEPMLIACIALWAIARGSDVVSGEVARGTMEMVLAQPVSRRMAFATQSAVTLIGIALIVLVTWVAMWFAIQTSSVTEYEYAKPLTFFGVPLAVGGDEKGRELVGEVQMRDHVNAFDFWPGILNLFFFGFFLCGFTAMFSAFDRFRWRTIGAVTGIYTVMAAIKLFAEMSPTKSWDWTLWLTFFSCYEPEVAIADFEKVGWAAFHLFKYNQAGEFVGLNAMGHNLALVLMGVICYTIGLRFFKHRDIPAPL